VLAEIKSSERLKGALRHTPKELGFYQEQLDRVKVRDLNTETNLLLHQHPGISAEHLNRMLMRRLGEDYKRTCSLLQVAEERNRAVKELLERRKQR